MGMGLYQRAILTLMIITLGGATSSCLGQGTSRCTQLAFPNVDYSKAINCGEIVDSPTEVEDCVAKAQANRQSVYHWEVLHGVEGGTAHAMTYLDYENNKRVWVMVSEDRKTVTQTSTCALEGPEAFCPVQTAGCRSP